MSAQLGLNLTSYWEPWWFTDPLYGDRLGGYYTKWDGLHFATVRGAGHEVPAYRPAAAYKLVSMFLALETTGLGLRITPPPSLPPFPPGENPLPPPPAPPPSAPLPPSAPDNLFACDNVARGSTVNATSVTGNAAGDALLPFCVSSAGGFMFSSCGSTFDTWLRVYRPQGSDDHQAACSPPCEYDGDGDCDDGGPGSEYSECALGTECDDCGTRAPSGLGEMLMSCDDCGPCSNKAVVHGRLEVGCYVLVVDGYSTSEGDYKVTAKCLSDGALLGPVFPPGLAPLPPPPATPSAPPASPPPPPPSAASPPPSTESPTARGPNAASDTDGVSTAAAFGIAVVALLVGIVGTVGFNSFVWSRTGKRAMAPNRLPEVTMSSMAVESRIA